MSDERKIIDEMNRRSSRSFVMDQKRCVLRRVTNENSGEVVHDGFYIKSRFFWVVVMSDRHTSISKPNSNGPITQSLSTAHGSNHCSYERPTTT